MCRPQKVTSVVLAILIGIAVAPVSEASMIVLTPAACPAMAKAMPVAPHACCGSGCECSIEQPKGDLSVDVPVARPDVRLSQAPDAASVSSIHSFFESDDLLSAQESPPQETPLYQEYSEYRL